MLAERIDVVIGVDTHKHTHTAAAVSPTGTVVDSLTVSADRAGYRQLAAFGVCYGGRRLWAIEGTGTFGAGLTSLLVVLEEEVVEVDRPVRSPRRSGAKSDEIDAARAAREALARDHLGVPRGRGEREAIRVLLTTRAGAIEARTAALSALHALVTTAPEELRQRLRVLPTGALVRTCAALRTSRRHSSEQFATVPALRRPPGGSRCANGRPPSSSSSSRRSSARSLPSSSNRSASGRWSPASSWPPGRTGAGSTQKRRSPSSPGSPPSPPRPG